MSTTELFYEQTLLNPADLSEPQNIVGWIGKLLNDLIIEQHEVIEFGGGEITASSYDVAWIARVIDPADPTRLAFPQALDWLLQNQAVDGSWSGQVAPYSLVPTLAGLTALLSLPDAHNQFGAVQLAARQAEQYLREWLPRWNLEGHEGIAFEVLTPGLLAELESLGKFFDFPARAELMALYNEKMKLAGALDLLYSGRSNLIHSLEAFGPKLNWHRLKAQQATNGSYGCSPAATAAVLLHNPEWDEAAANWLRYLLNRGVAGVPGTVATAFPIDAFEASWVAYNLSLAGFDLRHDLVEGNSSQLLGWLESCLAEDGSGGSFARIRRLPGDSDDTGMLLAALNLAGVRADAKPLFQFERDNYFTCYQLERGASISANTHVLAALLSLPLTSQLKYQPSIEKIVRYLFENRQPGGYWQDKWHFSPYYATFCVVAALAENRVWSQAYNLRSTVRWILETQHPDGGWGRENSTLEESAYAVQILQLLSDQLTVADLHDYTLAYSRGLVYLSESWERLVKHSRADKLENGPTPSIEALVRSGHQLFPRQWVAKEPYAPVRVIFSAVLATLYRAVYRTHGLLRSVHG